MMHWPFSFCPSSICKFSFEKRKAAYSSCAIRGLTSLGWRGSGSQALESTQMTTNSVFSTFALANLGSFRLPVLGSSHSQFKFLTGLRHGSDAASLGQRCTTY